MDTLDFTQDGFVGESDLARISQLALRQTEAEQHVKDVTLELAKAESSLTDIRERELPELMLALGLEEIRTKDGLRISVDTKIRASLPQKDMEKQKQAFTWLEDHHHEHLIKRQFIIQFGKMDERWARKFEGDLKKRKKPLEVTRKMTIHSGTLAAFITNELAAGTDVPMELFQAYQQKFTKIQRV